MKKKKKYVAPQLELIIVALDHGIAVGSAIIRTTRDDQQILEEIETEHQVIDIDW
ncbi:hypothetical protein ACFRAE_06440 [Sphingobacterium sp. HJSM2_6]|uniref:hypothetical protein n=1 Tax=Sphingobacterium sp. HJSM2_6 TaxID=3366264 RepID=UPI003BCF9118